MKRIIKKYKEQIIIAGIFMLTSIAGVVSALLYAKYVWEII